MNEDICWNSNVELADRHKGYLNEMVDKNYSEIINILIQNGLIPKGTVLSEAMILHIENMKENLNDLVYSSNPAQELGLCVINNLFWTFIPAVILFFGTLGNVMSFIVLCNLTGKTVSTFIYLSILALVDQFVLICGLLRSWIDHLLMSKMENRNKIFCKLSQFLGTSASVLSVWLIVAVTLERTIVISFPFQAHNLIQKNRAIIIATIMACVIIFLNSHFLFTVDLVKTISAIDNSKNISLCIFSNQFSSFETSWILIDAIVYSFLPFTLILILNIVIMVKVCQARKTRRSMMTLKRSQHSSERSESTRQLTVMLLMISGTFLLTTTPIFIVKMIHWAPAIFKRKQMDKNELTIKDIAVSQFADSIAAFLMHLNHAMNFYLYCASGNKFRSTLKSLFRKWWLLKCFWNSPDPMLAGQQSLYANSVKMTRHVNSDSKAFNDNRMMQVHPHLECS